MARLYSLEHKFAIAFTVEMDFKIMGSAPHAPVVWNQPNSMWRPGVSLCNWRRLFVVGVIPPAPTWMEITG